MDYLLKLETSYPIYLGFEIHIKWILGNILNLDDTIFTGFWPIIPQIHMLFF